MNEQRKYQIWLRVTISGIVLSLAFAIVSTIIFDPFFHYHGPIKGLQYPMEEEAERALNDGIAKNFVYDGIITGTSMAENFKASEAEALWGGSFIKIAFRGASYKEINDVLIRAFESDNEIKTVIRPVDFTGMLRDKDFMQEGSNIYDYMSNDNIWDDVKYLLNKEILIHNTLRIPRYTLQGKKTTSFDEYENWNSRYTFGKESILETIPFRRERATEQRDLTDAERVMIMENVKQNICQIAVENPETEFYLFFSPYSIYYWDEVSRVGEINCQVQAEEMVIEELLKYPNIKLFSFTNKYEWICNPDNYKDAGHYGEWINSEILRYMKEGNYQLTEENYKEYLEQMQSFYGSYDYDSLF